MSEEVYPEDIQYRHRLVHYRKYGRFDEKNKGREFPLPAYKSLFEVKNNPIMADEDTIEWDRMLFEYSLMSEDKFYAIASVSDLTGLFYPLCPSKERLRNAVLFINWLFVFDEHLEHYWGDIGRDVTACEKLCQEVIDLLEVKPFESRYIPLLGKKPYNVFLYALAMDMFRELPLLQQKRFVRLLKAFLSGSIEESKRMAEDYQWKSIEELLEVRYQSTAGMNSIQMIEYLMDCHLSEDEWELDPAFSRITRLITDTVGIGNDIGSFEKEYRNEKGRLNRCINIVATYMSLEGCDVKTALDKSVQYYAKVELELKQLIDDFCQLERATDKQKRFLSYIGYINSGSYWAGCRMDRYIYNLNLD